MDQSLKIGVRYFAVAGEIGEFGQLCIGQTALIHLQIDERRQQGRNIGHVHVAVTIDIAQRWRDERDKLVDLSKSEAGTVAYGAAVKAVAWRIAERDDIQIALTIFGKIDWKFQVDVRGIAAGNYRFPLR